MKPVDNSHSALHPALYSGLIRLHVLHHACEEPIFGLGMIEELARHGYKLSAGTLYPLLHGMERNGLLRASEEKHGKTSRKLYRATPAGRRALRVAKKRVKELFGELFEVK
jgi:PadR family transcriptional regulator